MDHQFTTHRGRNFKGIGYLHKNNYQSDIGSLPKFRLAEIISDSSYEKNILF